jgi:hypothetical protein
LSRNRRQKTQRGEAAGFVGEKVNIIYSTNYWY